MEAQPVESCYFSVAQSTGLACLVLRYGGWEVYLSLEDSAV